MSRLCEEDKNAEAQRSRSFGSRLFSVISVPQCFKTSLAEHGYVRTPGRYVGAAEVEHDDVAFAERMEGLNRQPEEPTSDRFESRGMVRVEIQTATMIAQWNPA